MQNMQLSERIKLLCKQNKVSVKSLLENCDMNRNTIYDLEKKCSFPSCDKIAKIADYLDCSVDYLLGRTDISEVNKGYSYLSQIEDDPTITPYIAAYGGNAPQKTSISFKTTRR